MRLRSGLSIFCAIMLIGGSAAAQTQESGAQADLSVEVGPIPATPLVGDVVNLSFTVSNGGPDDAQDVSFSNYVPAEFELQSVSSSDPDDVCGSDSYGQGEKPPTADGGTSPSAPDRATPDYYGGGAFCSMGTMTSSETATITMSVRRIGARESYMGPWVGASTEDPSYENNYTELIFEADKSSPADLSVSIASPRAPDVDSNFTYTISARNNGPSSAQRTTLVNPLPYGVSFVGLEPSRAGDSCEFHDGASEQEGFAPEYGGYSELTCELGPLDQGQTAGVAVTVRRASAWEIYNSAWVQTSSYDANYENDYASFQIPADPSVTSDLFLRLTGPAVVPLVGETFTLAATVGNRGPASAGDVWLNDFLPEGVEFVSVAPSELCSYNDHGPYPMAEEPTAAPTEKGDAYYPIQPGGIYCALGSLPVGESSTVSMTVTRTRARELWNSAWVSSSNYEPQYENNYGELLIGPDTSTPADVQLELTAPENPEVGSDFNLELSITNLGPSRADDVVVTDYLPYGTEFRSVSASDTATSCSFTGAEEPAPAQPQQEVRPIYYGGREVICRLGSVEPGATSKVTITVNRTSPYELWNSAAVSTANYDADLENDYATLLISGEPYPGACPADGSVGGTKDSDTIVVGDCTVASREGNDAIEVAPSSSAGDSRVTAGRGADAINVLLSFAGAGTRVVEALGGSGADTFTLTVSPGAGNALVVLNGGSGSDTFHLDVAAGVRSIDIVIKGGLGRDSITWSSADDAGAGSWPKLSVRGGDQADSIQAGFGDDTLRGGRGNDRLFGSHGNDIMRGGAGFDTCRGGPGEDLRFGC